MSGKSVSKNNLLVALTEPMTNRWLSPTTYCVGRVAHKPLTPSLKPIVSAFAQQDIDLDTMESCVSCRVVYSYNANVRGEDAVYHEMKTAQFDNWKDAVKWCESAFRGCYAMACVNGVASEVSEGLQ